MERVYVYTEGQRRKKDENNCALRASAGEINDCASSHMYCLYAAFKRQTYTHGVLSYYMLTIDAEADCRRAQERISDGRRALRFSQADCRGRYKCMCTLANEAEK